MELDLSFLLRFHRVYSGKNSKKGEVNPSLIEDHIQGEMTYMTMVATNGSVMIDSMNRPRSDGDCRLVGCV